MALVRDGELGQPVRQVGDAERFAAAREDVVEAAQLHRRQVLAVGVARAALNGARHADHALDAGVVRRDLVVGDRPIHVVTAV